VIYRAFVVLVFIAVIVGSIILGGQQREATSTTTVDEVAGNLGYAARRARIIETGPDGRALYTLDADLIDEPPDSANIHLQQVRMGFRDATGHEWTGRADAGMATQDTGQIELSGNVRVSGMLPGSPDEANISTESLSVDTHAQVVTTNEPVTLTMSGGTVKAKGLSVNVNTGVVQLKSSVHGTYSQ